MKKTILAVILMAVTGGLYAQKGSMEDTTYVLQEASVQGFARKKAELVKLDVPMNYLPMSITTVSSQTLDIAGVTSIEEAVRFLPGVRINTGYGGFQTLYIRGFSGAPIMIDGVRDERTMINSFPFPDLTDVESMELLKGPASVLYGQSVVGGILNIKRKAPTATPTINARLRYGSYENKQATLGFGGNIAGNVNYLASVNYANQDGWRDNGNERFSGYLAISSPVGRKGSLEFRGGFNHDFYGTEIGLPANMSYDTYNLDGSLYLAAGEQQPGLNKKARYNNESDFFYHDRWDVSAKYQQKLWGDFKLQEYLSYSYDDINYFGTEELSYLENSNPIYNHYYYDGANKMYICLDTVALTFPLRFSHMAETVNNQLDLSGSFMTGSIKHNIVAGYSFVGMNRNSYSGYTLAPTSDPLNSNYDVYGPGLYSHVVVNNPRSMGYMDSKFSKANITRNYSHGIYVQDLVELSDKLKVLLAGRWDAYKYMRATAPTYGGGRQYHKAEQTPYSTITTSAFTYRGGLVYMPVNDLSIYGSMSSFFSPYRTFYSPTTIYIDKDGNEFYPENSKEIFKPQEGYQAEVGARYTYKNLLQASASVFYIKRYNETKNIATFTDPDTNKKYTVTGQVGQSESKGFDLEVRLFPVKNLMLAVGYAYTNAEIAELKKNKYMETDPQEGLKLPGVPENTFIGMASYTIPSGWFRNLSFNANISFMDKVYRYADNSSEFSSYWLTDVSASYPLRNGITLSLNVNNLFNEDYINQSLGNQMVPSMPRNYLITVAYSFK